MYVTWKILMYFSTHLPNTNTTHQLCSHFPVYNILCCKNTVLLWGSMDFTVLGVSYNGRTAACCQFGVVKSFKNDRYSLFLRQCTMVNIHHMTPLYFVHQVMSISPPHKHTPFGCDNKEIYEHSCIYLCVDICFIWTFSCFSLASTQVCAIGIDGLQVKIWFIFQIWQWHSYFIMNLSLTLSKRFQRDRVHWDFYCT